MTSTFFTILPNAVTLSEATSGCKRKQGYSPIKVAGALVVPFSS